jgi:hypothetical protein
MNKTQEEEQAKMVKLDSMKSQETLLRDKRELQNKLTTLRE